MAKAFNSSKGKKGMKIGENYSHVWIHHFQFYLFFYSVFFFCSVFTTNVPIKCKFQHFLFRVTVTKGFVEKELNQITNCCGLKKRFKKKNAQF